jgi:hypothetical protein
MHPLSYKYPGSDKNPASPSFLSAGMAKSTFAPGSFLQLAFDNQGSPDNGAYDQLGNPIAPPDEKGFLTKINHEDLNLTPVIGIYGAGGV